MRIALALAVCVLTGCASDKLASAPPAGVDLGGHWKLNVADSDDPQRLMQSQIAAATANTTPDGQTRSPGRGGRNGGRGSVPGGPTGPMMPSVLVLDEGLRWPGMDLTINQANGTVTFTSDGNARSCRPHQGRGHPHGPSGGTGGHDAASRGRGDAPPPRCGWDERTLVVQSGEPDEDHPPFEQRFSVSEDGQRLEEIVVFKGGRSNGFVASREWDRAPAGGGALKSSQ
jgi:hypothetical protein